MEIEECLRNIVQKKYRVLEEKLKKYELVKGQAELLLFVKDNNGVTQNELAQLLGIRDSSMSVRLNKLEKLEYISRIIDDQNLKKKKVYITPLGNSICGQCRRFKRELTENMYKGFSKRDRAQLENYLNKLEKNLEIMKKEL